MSFKIIVTLVLVICAIHAQEHPIPEPYNFQFEAINEDGSSTLREETGDPNGRITGFYILKNPDGQSRRVDYVADEDGFRAEIATNEIGTKSHESAGALYHSSAPSISELIAQWELASRSRNQHSDQGSKAEGIQSNNENLTTTSSHRDVSFDVSALLSGRQPSSFAGSSHFISQPGSAASTFDSGLTASNSATGAGAFQSSGTNLTAFASGQLADQKITQGDFVPASVASLRGTSPEQGQYSYNNNVVPPGQAFTGALPVFSVSGGAITRTNTHQSQPSTFSRVNSPYQIHSSQTSRTITLN